MNEAPPIPCIFDGQVFRPIPPHQRTAAQHYGAGEVVLLVAENERSAKSHRHYFAAVKLAWMNLPEDQVERFPTPEHLRKWALIKTGYCNQAQVPCTSRAEALRWQPYMAAADTYSLVVVTGAVVTIFTAQSQKVRAMGAKVFQASKEAVLDHLADMVGVTTQQLMQARAA